MVIKKDPRALLEMLGRPVEVEDDEFLDRLEKKVDIHDMPSAPPEELRAGPVLNEQQEAMLRAQSGDADAADGGGAAAGAVHPVTLAEADEKHRRFFGLFAGARLSKKGNHGASVPAAAEALDFSRIHVSGDGALPEQLPDVADSAEEKAAKAEDAERRAANIAAAAEAEARAAAEAAHRAKGKAPVAKSESAARRPSKHDAFLANFDRVLEDH